MAETENIWKTGVADRDVSISVPGRRRGEGAVAAGLLFLRVCPQQVLYVAITIIVRSSGLGFEKRPRRVIDCLKRYSSKPCAAPARRSSGLVKKTTCDNGKQYSPDNITRPARLAYERYIFSL